MVNTQSLNAAPAPEAEPSMNHPRIRRTGIGAGAQSRSAENRRGGPSGIGKSGVPEGNQSGKSAEDKAENFADFLRRARSPKPSHGAAGDIPGPPGKARFREGRKFPGTIGAADHRTDSKSRRSPEPRTAAAEELDKPRLEAAPGQRLPKPDAGAESDANTPALHKRRIHDNQKAPPRGPEKAQAPQIPESQIPESDNPALLSAVEGASDSGASQASADTDSPSLKAPGIPLSPLSAALESQAETASGGRIEVADHRPEPRRDSPRGRFRARRGRNHSPRMRAGAAPSAPGGPAPSPSDPGKFALVETEIGASPRSPGRPSPDSPLRGAADLARRLDTEAGSEIVRQVKVVLNRADAGEIRISLRPEHLGRVRVRIRMEENRLSGRIFVESAAAREAFRSALDGLQTKLVESGFGAADLELAWDEQSMADPRGSRESPEDRENSGPRRPPGGPASESAAGEFENHGTRILDGAPGEARVNLVV